MATTKGNCELLESDPSVPFGKYPSLFECNKFTFMRLSQMCEIAE